MAQTPQKGGVLRVSVPGSPRLIDPPITGSAEEWMVTSWLYSNLTRVDDKFHMQPDLAESWQATEGGKVWTFTLRSGVNFHSGREVQAEGADRAKIVSATSLRTTRIACPPTSQGADLISNIRECHRPRSPKTAEAPEGNQGGRPPASFLTP